MKQAPPAAKPSSIVLRSVVGVLIVLVALVGAALAVRPWLLRDGSPDDRLLATMQQVAWDAQTVLDETGELPNSLHRLLLVLHAESPGGSELSISYHRLGASSIRLCGEFSKRSSGQTTARPFYDVIVGLQPALTGPRPARGHHCYDVALEPTEPSAREDALLFRQMNAAATAAECAFSATAQLPKTISEAEVCWRATTR